MRKSIWAPPDKVNEDKIKGAIDYDSGNVTISWEPAKDVHSGLWGYYYEWDTQTDTIPPPNWNKWTEHKLSLDTTHWESPKLEKGKEYWFHIRSVDYAGNMADTTHEGPFIINCSPHDSDCDKCEKCEEGICNPIIPCCGNGIPEVGENEFNCPQDCKPDSGDGDGGGPGNDHPDETYDVSTSVTTSAVANSSTAPEVAILSSGFATSTASLLASLNEPSTRVDIDFSPDIVEDYPLLIIPTGGLYGLDSLPTFKSNLEEYVKNGGILIVFSQQHGYEYRALPGGNLSGFGWLEDQSCHYSSVYIDTYHPILSGQDSVTSDVTVDGYFTKYPENATILLSRTKNGMPAMLMYEYGNGTVIASTIYTDWASTHYQATQDGKNLVRDILAWANDKTEISEYGMTDTVNICINRTIPEPDLPEYPEYELGDVVDVPINVTNYFNMTVDKVSFIVYDPDMEIDYVNVSTTIPENETRTVDFSYEDTDKEGFYLVSYSICIGESCIQTEDFAYFFGVNITLPVSYRANYIVLDPDKNVITNESVLFEENVSVANLPANVTIFNFTYTNPSKLGIWRLEYEILNVNDMLIEAGTNKFAASKYAENPRGFAYEGQELTIWATSLDDHVAVGSEVLFTIHVKNDGDSEFNGNIAVGGHEAGGRCWAYYGAVTDITVPAHSQTSYSYSHCMDYSTAVYFGLFEEGVEYEDEHFHSGTIAISEKGIWVFQPSIDVNVQTDKQVYSRGEKASIFLNLKNRRDATYDVSATVRIIDPENNKAFEDTFSVTLAGNTSGDRAFDFSLPTNANCGIYLVSAEAHVDGEKVGSGSTYFDASKSYSAKLCFDQQDKAYKIRQNMTVHLNITTFDASVLNSAVNITIPDLAFVDSKFVVLNPNETERISYDLNIPENVTAGKHDVTVTFSYDDETLKDCFIIPESNLVVTVEKASYKAGENINCNLTNSGGVDTTRNCSIELYNPRGLKIYANATHGSILAGETQTFTYNIPEQAVNGNYYLFVSYTDLNTGKATKMSKSFVINGLKASVSSVTDKKVYLDAENVSIRTNITNLDGAIVDGKLNLKLVRPYAPHNSTHMAGMSNHKSNVNQLTPFVNIQEHPDFAVYRNNSMTSDTFHLSTRINDSVHNPPPHLIPPEYNKTSFHYNPRAEGSTEIEKPPASGTAISKVIGFLALRYFMWVVGILSDPIEGIS